MKTYNNLYNKICSYDNLILAYKKTRKGKSKKDYVINYSRNLKDNLLQLRNNLLFHSYNPKKLETFIIRDPKTRKISKSSFEDRIVHHAIVNILEPIYEKIFIYDSYANRKNKGTLEALKRFDIFKRKVSKNNKMICYVLKADIKHYFETIDHNVLLSIIKKKITCNRTIWLIKKILNNYQGDNNVGMPLGNLTSQFFANVYLNELDYFIKHELEIKFYIRYVDDFVIFNISKNKLILFKKQVNNFLKEKLNIGLHQDKSKIILIEKGISFLGFRIFYHYKLLKKFNRRNIKIKINKLFELFSKSKVSYDKIYESVQSYFAYMKYANCYLFKKKISRKLNNLFPNEISSIEINRCLKLNFF